MDRIFDNNQKYDINKINETTTGILKEYENIGIKLQQAAIGLQKITTAMLSKEGLRYPDLTPEISEISEEITAIKENIIDEQINKVLNLQEDLTNKKQK